MQNHTLSIFKFKSLSQFRAVSTGVVLAALLAVVSVSASAQPAPNNGMDSLEKFVTETRSGRADFVQTVTSPARTGEAPRVKKSTGTFEFSRPNRFRFFYQKP